MKKPWKSEQNVCIISLFRRFSWTTSQNIVLRFHFNKLHQSLLQLFWNKSLKLLFICSIHHIWPRQTSSFSQTWKIILANILTQMMTLVNIKTKNFQNDNSIVTCKCDRNISHHSCITSWLFLPLIEYTLFSRNQVYIIKVRYLKNTKFYILYSPYLTVKFILNCLTIQSCWLHMLLGQWLWDISTLS